MAHTAYVQVFKTISFSVKKFNFLQIAKYNNTQIFQNVSSKSAHNHHVMCPKVVSSQKGVKLRLLGTLL